MSDYLANIGQRSLAMEQQAIRPRLLSVFEPFQATGVVGFPQQSQAEENYRLPDSDAGRMDGITPIGMASKEQPVGQGAFHMIPLQAPSLNISVMKPDPQSVTSQTIDQLSGQGMYGPAAAAFPPEPVVSIGPKFSVDETISPILEAGGKSLVESPDKHRTARNSRSSATGKELNGTAHESVVPERLSETAGTIPERILLKPAVERAEMEKPVTIHLPRQPLAPLPSRLERALAEKKDSLQKISPPTINVTIGRIEVRATPAPNKNPPQPKRQGAMGLDEYLRMRNGGER